MPDDNTAPEAKSTQRVIKKYPNRRLYDTSTSTYVTLAEVKQLVMNGESVAVRDAKSGEDLTRSILLQIILDLFVSWQDSQRRIVLLNSGATLNCALAPRAKL